MAKTASDKGFRSNNVMVEYFLNNLNSYKTSMAYQGKDFNDDRSAQRSF